MRTAEHWSVGGEVALDKPLFLLRLRLRLRLRLQLRLQLQLCVHFAPISLSTAFIFNALIVGSTISCSLLALNPRIRPLDEARVRRRISNAFNRPPALATNSKKSAFVDVNIKHLTHPRQFRLEGHPRLDKQRGRTALPLTKGPRRGEEDST